MFWPCCKWYFVSLLQLDRAWESVSSVAIQVWPWCWEQDTGMSRSWCPKAQPSGNPRTPRAGAALWHDGSGDLCHVNSHASDSGWQLWGIKSLNFTGKAPLLVLSGAGLAMLHTHMHPHTCTYHQPSLFYSVTPPVQLGRTAWNMHTWPPGKLTWASRVLTITWQFFWVKFPPWFLYSQWVLFY